MAHDHKKYPALNSWAALNTVLRSSDLLETQTLFKQERENLCRPSYLKRLRGRILKLNLDAARESMHTTPLKKTKRK